MLSDLQLAEFIHEQPAFPEAAPTKDSGLDVREGFDYYVAQENGEKSAMIVY